MLPGLIFSHYEKGSFSLMLKRTSFNVQKLSTFYLIKNVFSARTLKFETNRTNDKR